MAHDLSAAEAHEPNYQAATLSYPLQDRPRTRPPSGG